MWLLIVAFCFWKLDDEAWLDKFDQLNDTIEKNFEFVFYPIATSTLFDCVSIYYHVKWCIYFQRCMK